MNSVDLWEKSIKIHNSLNDKSYLSSKLYLFIEKFMKIFSDHYILVSKYDQTIGVKNKIISINNSTLIYNGSQDLGINSGAKRAEL